MIESRVRVDQSRRARRAEHDGDVRRLIPGIALDPSRERCRRRVSSGARLTARRRDRTRQRRTQPGLLSLRKRRCVTHGV